MKVSEGGAPAAARIWGFALGAALCLAGEPAGAGFSYVPERAGAEAAAGMGEARAGCGYSSAGLLPEEGTPRDGRHEFRLRCGERLAAALGRWGAAHGVLVVGPADGSGAEWRVAVDYRFLARDFASALERLGRFEWPAPRPVFSYDAENRVLAILAESPFATRSGDGR